MGYQPTNTISTPKKDGYPVTRSSLVLTVHRPFPFWPFWLISHLPILPLLHPDPFIRAGPGQTDQECAEFDQGNHTAPELGKDHDL